MTRRDHSKTGAIRRATVTLFLSVAVTGCADQGESRPVPKPEADGGASAAASPDAGKAPIAVGTKKPGARPRTQNPGDPDYGDKPGARNRGR